MASKQRHCAKCGLLISTGTELSLGSGKQPTCSCPRSRTQRESTHRTPTVRRCAKCGLLISTGTELSLGSGRQPTCSCTGLRFTRQSTRQTPTQNITYDSSTLSVAEQIVLLVKLRSDGSLTEQEFQTLKNRLVLGGNS
jgi:hypothetical protein